MPVRDKKQNLLIRALLQLVVCVVILLLCLPVGERLAPLRKAIWLPLGKKVGAVAVPIVVVAAGGGAVRALSILAGLLNKKLHMPLDWGRLLYALGILAFGIVSLVAFDSIGFLVGLAMTAFGGYLLYQTIRQTRSAMILDRDGETIIAEICSITHGSVSENGSYIYTVSCRADGRVFTKKTKRPMDIGDIGKKVYVRVSAGSPEIYDVDLDNLIVYESDDGLPPEEGKAPPGQSPDAACPRRREEPDRSAVPAEPVRQEDARTSYAECEKELPPQPKAEEPVPADSPAEEKPAEPSAPLSWECTRSYIRFPTGPLLCFVVLVLMGIFFEVQIRTSEGKAFCVFFLPGLLLMLISLGKMRSRARYYRYGRQVRAQLTLARLSMRIDGDPVYKVECRADGKRFSGRMRMPLEDSELEGKWVTVFVSEHNPDRYLIEGRTVSKEP